MAEATKDDGVLFKKTIFGIDLEYTKTDAAIDTALVAGGAAFGGVGAAPAAGVAALRSGAMMVGRGIIRSVFKTAAKEGAEVAAKASVKAAATETTAVAAKAVAKDTIGASVGQTAKTKLTDASEDALAALAKAKAAGEAERAGVKVATQAATAGAETAAEAAAKVAAGAAAKTVTKEGVEAASKSLGGMALKAGSYAWTGLKVTSFPFRHPVLTLGGLSAAHLATGGASSNLIWDGAIGTWNATKHYAPAVTDTVFEGSLKLGDGLMGFLATGGQKGAEGLKNHLPPGTPLVLREALGNVGKPKNEGDKAPSLTEQARSALSGSPATSSGAGNESAPDQEQADGFDSPEARPFREMIGKQLNVDPSKVNGKMLTEKLGQLAKDNPMFAIGLGIGTLYGATGAGKTPMERTMGGLAFGLAFGVMFQFIGQMYPQLMPNLMRAFAGAPDALSKAPGAISQAAGLNTGGVRGNFSGAANGETEAPAYRPLPAYTARTEMGASFGQAVTPAPAPVGEERVDLNRRRPEASNNSQFLLTAGM